MSEENKNNTPSSKPERGEQSNESLNIGSEGNDIWKGKIGESQADMDIIRKGSEIPPVRRDSDQGSSNNSSKDSE